MTSATRPLRLALSLLPVLVCSPAALGQESLPADEPGAAQPQIAPQDPASQLHERLTSLMAKCRRCRWGVLVKEAGSGRVLLERNSTLPFNPASNAKLVVATAVLERLGTEHRFETQLLGQRDGRRVIGGLYLRGGGDPTLTTADLSAMATRLVELGIDEVEGPVFLDTSFLQDRTDPPGYASFASSHPFRAGVDALSLDHNLVEIRIHPGDTAGRPGLVSLSSTSDYFKLQARVLTSARRTRLRVSTFSAGQQTGVNVSGRIQEGSGPVSFWRRLYHPSLCAGRALLDLLRERGVRVGPVLRRGTSPPALPVLALHASAPLGTILRRGTKRSINMVAEHLLLALGADVFGPPATFDKGRRAVELYLRGLGFRPGTFWIENGSGLSRKSRIRPVDLFTVLERMQQDLAIGPDLLSALSVAGVDGTLLRRFEGSAATGYVRAKSGTLSGVSCLSGVAGFGERRILFSFMAGRVRRLPVARRLQVAMAESLVDYLRQVAGPGSTER